MSNIKLQIISDVRELWKHDSLWNICRTDLSDQEPFFDKNAINVVPTYNDEPIGIFSLQPLIPPIMMVHIGIYKAFRGPIAMEAAALALESVKRGLSPHVLIGLIPNHRRAAQRFAKVMGFTKIETGSLLVDLITKDQIPDGLTMFMKRT